MNEEGGLNLEKSVEAVRRQIHIVVGVSILVTSAAFLKAWLEPPLFLSQFELLTEPVTLETQIISSTNSQTLSSREDVVSVEADELKLKVLKSPKILLPVVKQLQDKYPDITYDSLEQSLDLKTILQDSKSGNILEVTYSNTDNNKVRDVVNIVAETYLKYSLNVRQSNINQGIVFLDRQLPILRKEVDILQDKLQQLRQQNNLIDPIAQAALLSAQLDSFKKEQQMVQVDLAEAQMRANSQQQKKRTFATVLETERYQELKSQLSLIDLEIAKQSAIWNETVPQSQLLQEERKNLVSLLERESQEISKEVQILTSQRLIDLSHRNQALAQTIKDLEEKIKLLSVTTRQYVDFQRELEIVTENLNQFITKREALKIDAAQQQIPWEILTPPYEPIAISSGIKRNLIAGVMLGIILGIACAIFVEKLSNIIYTSEEIQEIINIPILAIIPFNKKVEDSDLQTGSSYVFRKRSREINSDQSHLSLTNLTFPFTEAFNSFYTNLCLLTPDNPIHSLVISSSGFAEGKTTIALHLALTAAAMGRRVLLVDTNLRNPKLHERMGLMNVLGLTDLISRNNLEPLNIIQRSWQNDNLFVLTCGQLPPDPIRLLSSEKMTLLKKKLQDSFELVIYDAPCLIGLADTYLLASHTDGVVLVTALGQIQRSELELAQEQLTLSRTQLWGIVANKSHATSSLKSHFLVKDLHPIVNK